MNNLTLAQWLHAHIPFAALLATEDVSNRPLLTRFIESAIVTVVAGVLSAYVALSVNQAVNHSEIEDLHRQIADLRLQIAQEHQDSQQWFQLLQDEISGIPAMPRQQRPQAVPGG